jgi:hypothetical protein
MYYHGAGAIIRITMRLITKRRHLTIRGRGGERERVLEGERERGGERERWREKERDCVK